MDCSLKVLTEEARWICARQDMGDAAPCYFRKFKLENKLKKATLQITALGVYEAYLNNNRVGNFYMAPGWTAYNKRLQVQTYDITELTEEYNILSVTVGKGWYKNWGTNVEGSLQSLPEGIISLITIEYEDGTVNRIPTDESWTAAESSVRFSKLYDGEIYDAAFTPANVENACIFSGPTYTLVPQQGPIVSPQEEIRPVRIFTTPAGETVADFGQELTGTLQISLTAHVGDIVDISFGEVLDKNGNFYTENYRSAKCLYHYTCTEGRQVWKPSLTFYGFRFIRINEFPGGPSAAKCDNFLGIVLHSEMTRTGSFSCSNTLLNRLYDNCIWGQKGNFLDVPTDCPQRDERLGWTGDALAFTKTAAINFDVEQFYRKWFTDMALEQKENGCIPFIVPNIFGAEGAAAWSDIVTGAPFEIYLAYGAKDILAGMFPCMVKWVDYIATVTKTPNLWTGCFQFGDWLGLDAPFGSYKGSTPDDFVASAFYAYSTGLVVRTGHLLGKDVSRFETLYNDIVNAFRAAYPVYETQTECALAVDFGLAEDIQSVSDRLDAMVKEAGTSLKTGFVGTPHILHALTKGGHTDTAYSLLLREDYPSWLYPVNKGATTFWEHWDGITPDGDLWSADMNSFNHYAYGAVFDWIYTVAAGIRTDEEHPGYEKIKIEPHPDNRLESLSASLNTRHGTVSVKWSKQENMRRYEITTPVESEIRIGDDFYVKPAGSYLFFEMI